MVLITLKCFFIGNGVAVSLTIDNGQSVAHLMDDMRVKRVNFSKDVDGSKLQLFLAKKEGAWLTRAGAEAVTVDELGHPRGFEKMVPSLLLQGDKYFGEKFQLSGGQVHVLAVVPEVPASKRRRFDAITSPRSEELVALAAFGQ
ncbi:hypothetical protein PC123_g4229 [Phytophthora cactorum]|nr:hypothetical protein PC123_g4229 [Phytophthora cactorum]